MQFRFTGYIPRIPPVFPDRGQSLALIFRWAIISSSNWHRISILVFMGFMFFGHQIDCNLSKQRLLEQYHQRYIWKNQRWFSITNEFRITMSMWIFFKFILSWKFILIFVVVLKTYIVRKTSLRVFKLSCIANIGNRTICPYCHDICVETKKCTNEL